MKRFLIAIVALPLFASGGCASSSSEDDAKMKPGMGATVDLTNKPKSAEQSAYNSQMQKTGDLMNQQQMKNAAAMEAARKQADGK